MRKKILFFFVFFLVVSRAVGQESKAKTPKKFSLVDSSDVLPENGKESHLPKCYRNVDDITNKSLVGKWVNGTVHHRGTFASDSRIEEWWDMACPAQMTLFSCSFHDQRKFQGHGYQASHQKYELEDCSLHPFEPIPFLTRLKNRNLVLCCDSTSMQIFVMIVCSLHGATTADYHLTWRDLSFVFPKTDCIDKSGVHCHLLHSQVFYSEFNVSIVYAGTHMQSIGGKKIPQESIDDYRTELGKPLRKQDILLLNHGAHFDPTSESMEAFGHYLEQIAADYSKLPEKDRFTLLWRETWAQHFDTTHQPSAPIGYYTTGNRAPCKAIETKQVEFLKSLDFRNTLANRIMSAYQIPILRIHNVSIFTAEQNIGLQHRKGEFEGVYDCTHYCENAGFLYFVRDILFNALLVL